MLQMHLFLDDLGHQPRDVHQGLLNGASHSGLPQLDLGQPLIPTALLGLGVQVELLLDGIHDDVWYIQHHFLHLSPDLFSLTSQLPAEMVNFIVLHNTDALWVILEGASVVPLGAFACENLEPWIGSHHPRFNLASQGLDSGVAVASFAFQE
ncbi:UNVERIFIED_CONTAM: hypothetical protein K2H54_048342 [Gekko kuhli]